MKHLTDEQLSALLDGALPATELAACEAHLAGCDMCRARLADADALDDSLEQSLAHDPGEAYFESFADRVAARIAEQGAGSPATSARPGRSLWGWLVSPRGLAMAGSTAALVLMAGLAWVRFHERGGTVSAFRAPSSSPLGSRLREQPGATAPSDQKTEAQADTPLPAPSAPEASAPPTGSFDGSPTPLHGARLQEPARMRELRRDENGEDVPVRQPAPAAETRTRDEATTSKLGMMKQRAAAPATGSAPEQGAPTAALAAPPTSAKRSPAPAPTPTANEAPAARSLAPSPSEGVAHAEREMDTSASSQALAPCGSVRDSRGRAVAGAQVVVVNDITRTSRTGPDGSFCLPRLERGDVVSVLRVGYDPVRITVGEDSPLAVVMEPVGTLGPEASKGLVTPGAPSALTHGFTSGTTKPGQATPTKASAPVPDPYAALPANVREAVAAAREAARVARRDRSADAMDAAALRWDAVTALVTGAVLHDARFRALSLRRESLSAAPTSERLTRFQADLDRFLAQAPHNLPEYATAQRWKSAVEPKNKALYR